MNTTDQWDPVRYEGQHSFVHKMGAGILDLLAPKPGERILDVGCGTGALTQKIADVGATVVGIDASTAMIDEARKSYPSLRFTVEDATQMRFDREFDAIFSNAALHWIKPPQTAIARMHAALKPGGRLVVEFGGHRNVHTVLSVASEAGRKIGIDLDPVLRINYFPSVSEYSSLLERGGFEVNLAQLFDRPTPLDGAEGLRNWIRMFRPQVISTIQPGQLESFFLSMERLAKPALFNNNGWFADYRRLRIVARRLVV